MRTALFALPIALLAAAPTAAETRTEVSPREPAPIVHNADGSFTITAAIEPVAEALDALPWEAGQEDGRGDSWRRPRDEADEAIDEAFEEAEDMARMDAGPD